MVRKTYAPVPFTRLKPGTAFHAPAPVLPERVSLDSPAVEIMTDLKKVCAVVIRPDESVDEAHRRMIQRGVRSLLVLDHERKVAGLITATDILGEKPMRVVAQRGCRRDEVVVSDIMTPRERLEVMDMDDVRSARVGNIVATLEASGRQHAMAVERDPDGKETLRGLFSATQIARQLGTAVQPLETARTFAEIGSLLAC